MKTQTEIKKGDRIMFMHDGWKFRKVRAQGTHLGVRIKREFWFLEHLAHIKLLDY